MKNKYPIYVISKGRWEKTLTCNALTKMGADFTLVVEPQELDRYKDALPSANISPLPFSNLGQGSIPARNWVWEDSILRGFSRHWILDDNIEQFNRMNNNLQVRADTTAIFRASEDFVDRYKNIGLAGFEYDFFCKSRVKWNAFRMNTRIYSCTLIKNDLPFRWRGKFNEDTDLSIRVLKSGFCTVLFLAFIQQKTQTMKMAGGNTDELYAETDNRLEFAESLQRQHPDVASVVWRFGRWHHKVDYRPFKKNALQIVEGINRPSGVNNYGMKIKEHK